MTNKIIFLINKNFKVPLSNIYFFQLPARHFNFAILALNPGANACSCFQCRNGSSFLLIAMRSGLPDIW
jgi:hypothetical protein